MSVEIETSALSMFESLNSLRSTPLVMHRIQVELRDVKVWYAVIRELNNAFGVNNWKGQSHVRRRLEDMIWDTEKTIWVWFDVPDEKIATWLAVKLAVTVRVPPGK
jgi:sugar-specific transcriptional regulator TrmB